MRLVGILRALLVLAVVPPILLYSSAVWLFTRDRRRAANAVIGTWVRWAGAIAGLRLEIEHAERIDAARPAVYLINHRSAADMLIGATLLRRDFTGIAKQELRRHPVFGPAFVLVGAVFVDRFDHEAAMRAMAPVADIVRGGLSVLIAPEGTRHLPRPLGPFKKGAFRLAMAAGVPVVPMVIHNAEDALPTGGLAIRPATVRVTVLPPRSPEHWTPDTLDAAIREIETAYRTTLAD